MLKSDNSAKIWAMALTGSTLFMAAMFALAAYYLAEIRDAVVHPGVGAITAQVVTPPPSATAVTGSTEVGTDTPSGVSLGTADLGNPPLPAIEPPAIKPPPAADPSKDAVVKDPGEAAPGPAVPAPKEPKPVLPKVPAASDDSDKD